MRLWRLRAYRKEWDESRGVWKDRHDTVLLRAKAGQFDAVLTMYHNQGQIAMKLMGFDRGVTMLGGYPCPICTPMHGIAGRGIANVGAAREALLLAILMAQCSTQSAAAQVATAATGVSA